MSTSRADGPRDSSVRLTTRSATVTTSGACTGRSVKFCTSTMASYSSASPGTRRNWKPRMPTLSAPPSTRTNSR